LTEANEVLKLVKLIPITKKWQLKFLVWLPI
jgi:hypothetical protein